MLNHTWLIALLLLSSLFVQGDVPGDTTFETSFNEDLDPKLRRLSSNSEHTKRTVAVNNSQIVAITVESNDTSINLGERTLLTVKGTYADGHTEEITENIVWKITPTENIEISGNVVTAIKDGTISIQAKVDQLVSEALELDIYWEINGHRLPTEPDTNVNNATLLGLDANDNGVRDDVERKIYLTFNKEIKRQYYLQEARHLQSMLADPDLIQNAHVWQKRNNYNIACRSFLRRNNILRLKIENIQFIEEAILTTKDRIRKYIKYDRELSGGVYGVPNELRIESSCDFNIQMALEVDK